MGISYNPRVATNGLVLYLDPANKKSYSQNYHPNPLDIFGWYSSLSGTSNNATVSRDTIPSPVGNTPLKMVPTGNDSHIGTYNATKWNLATAKTGQTWTVSVWAKASAATTGQIFIFEANSSGLYVQAPALTINITTEWQRFSYSYTFVNATTTHIQTRLDGPDVFASVNIWWDGLQVERSSSATDFTSVYTGENILNLASSSNNGTFTNGPSYTGSNAGSLSFDGVDDFLLLSSNTTFGNNTTWEAWVYCTGNVSTYNMFMGRYLPYFSFFTGNRLYFSNNIGSVQQTIQTAADLLLNTWYHAAFTTSYDGVNTTMKIYTNGVETATGTFAGTQGNYNNPFMVGDGNNGSNTSWYPFAGRVSGVKIYNRTLSVTEIEKNFNTTRSRFGI